MKEKKLDFSKMTQEEFLKAAVIESVEREMAELEAMDIDVPEPTEEQKKEIQQAIEERFGKA